MLDHVPVTSSNLVSVGYDSEEMMLEVAFKSGSIYRYSNVPMNVHVALMVAESKGKFFHQHIRKAYQFERLK
jgi:hypothetical protein